MCDTKDIFEQIGRIDSDDDDKIYAFTKDFERFYLDTCKYFIENSGDCLYGINMKPYKYDVIVSVKIACVFPHEEKTAISIQDILNQCDRVSFVPREKHMIIKLRYKNAIYGYDRE